MPDILTSSGRRILVDDEDFPRVAAISWNVKPDHSGTWRARHYWKVAGRQTSVGIARFVLDAPAGTLVDHINGDALDNRRCNLRLCTNAQNTKNRATRRDSTTGYKGVCLCKSSGKWFAIVTAEGLRHYCGLHSTKEQAARAYDAAALRLHGEFACLNFPAPGQRAA